MPGVGNGATHVAPDGGWGWVVVFASFVIQALTIGITYTFGILFVEFLVVFEAGESTTSWIGSIQPALLYLTGIVGGPLVRRFGWRAVTICGSVLSSVGFLTSSFSPNIYLLYFTYGGLTGIGNGLMYVTSMVAVQHYFDTKRAMATGLAVSGSGVGTLTFGVVTQKLLDSVGWQWTLRAQALIILLGALCGLLYRPLPDNDYVEETEDGDIIGGEQSALLDNSQEKKQQYGGTEARGAQGVAQRQARDLEEQRACRACSCCPQSFTEYFDPSLFRNPIFWFVCFSVVMFCFGYHVPYTYTPERAQRLGVPTSEASFLVSIMGIANVVSRLAFGWIGDRSPRIRFYLGGFVLTMGGLVSCFIFLCTTYAEMVVYSVLFGSFTGCWASLFPVILVDLLGIHLIEQSLGLCLAAGSGAFLVASPMSGMIIAKTGSYNAPFKVVGSAETVGGIVFLSITFLRGKYGYVPPVSGEQPALKRRRYVSESFS